MQFEGYNNKQMGACLEAIFAKPAPPQPKSAPPRLKEPGSQTGRPLRVESLKQEDPPDLKISLNDSHNNSGNRDTKIFTNNGSTGIGFSEQERRSSIFLGNPFETSSILMKGANQRCREPKECNDKFYTLIDKVYFIRKSMDSIKVSSPHGESQLNCPVGSIISTFYLTEGLPLQSIKEITTGKIIQTSNSPIRVTLKLKCRSPNCDRRIKLTYSKSFISTSEIDCDKCGEKGNWSLLDIDSNFPIWGDGHKIENHETMEEVPSPLRALGCISCMKYTCLEEGRFKELDCGCLLCNGCAEANQEQNQCHLCDS